MDARTTTRFRGTTAALIAVLAIFAAATNPQSAAAVSYSPFPVREAWGATANASPGMTVFLFHGGGGMKGSTLREGDVLEVSRCESGGMLAAVGKIRILGFKGALCLRAEVLDGTVRTSDVVATGSATSLVIPEFPLCRSAVRP